MFTPEQFIFEGLAQSLSVLVEGDLSSEARIHYKMSFLSSLVYNNAHIRVNKGESVEEVAKFIYSWCPWTDLEVLKRRVEQMKSDVLLRTYQYVYGISHFLFNELARNMDMEAKVSMLDEIYHKPLIARDFVLKWGSRHLHSIF